MVKVKICGLTNTEDALKAHELGADYLGFVFFDNSPRKITLSEARPIMRKLPEKAVKVGLFLDQEPDEVRRAADECGLNIIQLHGNEDPEYCARIKEYLSVLKAFRVKDRDSLNKIDSYGSVDFYLFDTYVKGLPGGTGKSFDWEILTNRVFNKPVFLAGGLTPKNVRRAIEKVSPYAVDVSSGVEREPGKKDHKLLKEFIENAKKK